MSSFVEFQAMVLGKLCSIEDRISKIENVLGISEEEKSCENIDLCHDIKEETPRENTFKDDISDFHKQLDDIKTFFAGTDY